MREEIREWKIEREMQEEGRRKIAQSRIQYLLL